MSASFNIHKLTDQLFRREAGKLSALLTKIFGTENMDVSEDVVQETFIHAMRIWPLKGVPDNPSGWLFRVAKNKAIDTLRRNKFSRQLDFNDPERSLLRSEYTLVTVMDKLWNEDEIQDDLLRMMFACCHPDIAPESQITLILKTLCGFSTSEIAKAFLTSEDTISKRLYRTKNFFREEKIKPAFPSEDALKGRLDAVLKAVYLLFNEGYQSTGSDAVIRKDLLDQAMYLCRLLTETTITALPETYAAFALMCFHAARINSRISDGGEIILLAQQDRSTWDCQLIEEGNLYMNKAATGHVISTYHIEAAIACEHCMAASFEQTNWKNILRYYDILVTILPNAITVLHRTTAVFKVHGAKQTLVEIADSPFRPEWEKHHLYYALLGDIHAGFDRDEAAAYYMQAFSMTPSAAEKNLLLKKKASL